MMVVHVASDAFVDTVAQEVIFFILLDESLILLANNSLASALTASISIYSCLLQSIQLQWSSSLEHVLTRHNWCGASLGGTLCDIINLIVRLFPGTFLHMMSSWRHATIHHNPQKCNTYPDHGGGAICPSSGVNLMYQHNPTHGQPVQGVGWGRSQKQYCSNS